MVSLHSKKIKITQAIKDHAKKQALQITKLGKKIINVSFFLETVTKKNNDQHSNKVIVQVQQPGKDVVVRSFASNLYEAISQASRSAARRIRKTAQKQIDVARSSIFD